MDDRSRYIIGIDLGTTNSCVAYVDTETSLAIQPFHIPQLASAGYIESLATLPSVCYLTRSAYNIGMPWTKERNYIVGSYALAQGGKAATQLVQSAKSWLCNNAANRKDKILPLDAIKEDERLSPVEATSYYLHHIREAWNHIMGKGKPENEFEQQTVILTVPASFDEVARTLTIEAAKAAGFTSMTLLEEPQAAFYSWISHHENIWQNELRQGDCILVCDVGGGTTDFSLIEVIVEQQQLGFRRMAVGNHLLLGGDNMDNAVAHFLEEKIVDELTTSQWQQLKYHARCAKEAIMGKGHEKYCAVIQGTGASVVKGTITVEINDKEIRSLLLDGFFGQFSWQEAIQLRKTSGIRSMGLPYEDEPSITKQLAYFLSKNPQRIPNYILFNGGTMKPRSFQEAILQSLQSWFPQNNIRTLTTESLDLAVSRGAAYFGKVRRGSGIRIGGGSSRTYYLGVGVPDENGNICPQVLTIMPRGCEEGYLFEPSQQFWLIPNMPVCFDLYASHVRIDDLQGTLLPIDMTSMQKLPPIYTLLRFGNKSQEKIQVKLSISFTELGTIELWLTSQQTNHKWSLEFQLRSSTGEEDSLASLQKARVDETFDISHLKNAQEVIKEVFTGDGKPKMLMESLEDILKTKRNNWPPSTLRGLWQTLLKEGVKRQRSIEHEIRWWNLAGILLKPGIGYPLDGFRIKELWKIILADLKNTKAVEVELQQCICFRRIAAGLNKGQQVQIAHHLLPLLSNRKTGKIEFKGKNEEYQYSERIRTLASLELMEMPLKIKLGNMLIKRITNNDALESDYWSLGRIGARQLLYGTIANVVPIDICLEWLEQLLKIKNFGTERLLFAISQLARKTGEKAYDIPKAMIDKILQQTLAAGLDMLYFNQFKVLLEQEVPLTELEKELIYGEKLPPGLVLTYGTEDE